MNTSSGDVTDGLRKSPFGGDELRSTMLGTTLTAGDGALFLGGSVGTSGASSVKFGDKRALALGAETTLRRNLVAADPLAFVAVGVVTLRLVEDAEGSRCILAGVSGDETRFDEKLDEPTDFFRGCVLDPALSLLRSCFLSLIGLSSREFAMTAIPADAGDEKNRVFRPLKPRPGDRNGV